MNKRFVLCSEHYVAAFDVSYRVGFQFHRRYDRTYSCCPPKLIFIDFWDDVLYLYTLIFSCSRTTRMRLSSRRSILRFPTMKEATGTHAFPPLRTALSEPSKRSANGFQTDTKRIFPRKSALQTDQTHICISLHNESPPPPVPGRARTARVVA